ncbi:MAG: uncharacterized protein K0S93_1536 [Nitrososphaeraceae archaeon]|nr:uncharacterized protein [Nitrososphaeraceae archaeon]
MIGRVFLSCWIMGLILIPTAISQSFASQMEVFLVPERDQADPIFTSIRFINLRYEPGSELSKIFNGTNERIEFSLNSTSQGMNEIQSAINEAFLREKNSPIQLSDSKLDYAAQIRGDENRAQISYKIKFAPHISNFVLPTNGTTQAVDLDWRSVVVQNPLTANIPEYGQFNINYPIGPIQALFPEAAQKFESAEETRQILNTPLLDYEEIGLPMDRWHFLFDPTGSQASAAGSGYSEESGSKVVSVFSLGESSFREGTHSAKEASATANIDGSEVIIKSSNPPPSGQIQISGFAQVRNINNAEIAFISPQGPTGTATATGGFPIQVLLILGGMMGAVAVLVLIKARKP